MSLPRGESITGHLPFTPVVIIGAGRSGTNALREVLTSLPQFSTWACDEINPIWRHGNALWPSDELPTVRARPGTRAFIRRAFLKIWQQTGRPEFIVEKTCANSLRVPFVDAVLPEARYLFLTRDGADVIASARKRWMGELEIPGMRYFAAKARYAPLRDLPLYGFQFVRNRLAPLLSGKRRLAVWGPRFAGMEQFADADLDELCARQWVACVDRSAAALASVGDARVLKVRYEDFVTHPAATLSAILTFLGTSGGEADCAKAISRVNATAVGKGRSLLRTLRPEILALIEPAMHAHGYYMK